MKELLCVENISKSFGGIQALDGINLKLKEKEIVGLIGPNGSGKTTMFDIITSFYKPDNGEIFFKGKGITSLLPHKVAKLGIGRTFQMVRLFPKMTVTDNLMVAEQKLHGEEFWKALLGLKIVKDEEKRNLEKAKKLLEFVELDSKAELLAENLSYGQSKLLEIARALAINPQLLLLDEPTAGLNPVIRKKIFSVIKKIKQAGKTVLIIEHDMETITSLCERVIVLDAGKVIAEGTPKEIQKNEKVLEAYLGHPKKVKIT